MFKKNIIEILEAKGLQYKDSGQNYLLSQCMNPNHKDTTPSMGINTEYGYGQCFTCGFYISPKQLLGLSNQTNIQDMLLTNKFTHIINKLESKFQLHQSTTYNFSLPPIDEEVNSYRGISKETLDTMGAYICRRGKFANRIIFPFYSITNELVGYTGRILDGYTHPAKYLHATGMDSKSNIITGKLIKNLKLDASELIITEGHMDALHLIQLGVAATPMLGLKAPNDAWTLQAIKLGVERLILCFDNDAPGKERMIGESSLLTAFKEKIPTTLGLFDNKTKWLYKSNFKDFGEAGEKIIGSSSMLELMMGT